MIIILWFYRIFVLFNAPNPFLLATQTTSAANHQPNPNMNHPSSPWPELPDIGFLAQIPSEHRAFLTGFGKFRRCSKDEIVIAEGSPQESLNLVLSGTLHIISNADERRILLAALGKGDSLGEINLFDPAAASATVIARSDCLIWSITRHELDGLLQADPIIGLSVMKGLLGQLSRRLRRMNEKLVTAEMWISDRWKPGTP